MRFSRSPIFTFAAILALVLLACGPVQTALPTRVPTSLPPPPVTARPSATPTESLPATRDISSPTPEPTQPLPTITPSPTVEVGPGSVGILSPGRGARLAVDTTVPVTGRGQPRSAEELLVISLVATDGRLLTEMTAPASEEELWEAALVIPPYVTGPAQLQAELRDSSGAVLSQSVIDVVLVLESTASDRYLSVFRPAPGGTAVAGHYLFFEGWAQRPNGVVTVGLLEPDCQTFAARQSFEMRGSGYWQGFLVVPRTYSGAGCAVVWTSDRGTESWREAFVPVSIVGEDDPTGRGVLISSPALDSSHDAGETLTIYGVVYNAVDDEVSVGVFLENGRVITQQIVDVQSWGYWEVDVVLPVDVSGPAVITVSTGNTGDAAAAQAEHIIEIIPVPTPTP